MSALGFSWGSKGRRTSGRRPRSIPKSTSKWVPKKARSISTKVQALTKAVSRLNHVSMNRIMYSQNQTGTLGNATGASGYVSFPLLKFSGWTRTFGTDLDDESNKQCLIRSINCPYTLTTNEPDDRYYSVWCVSLKDEANELLNTDGTLANLTQGTHYVSDASNTLLNLKYFTVHYHRKFTTGVVAMNKAAGVVTSAPAVQNVPVSGRDAMKLGTIKINFGKSGLFVKNPAGDWKAGNYPKDPSKNYFVLCFYSGESTADLEYGAIYLNQLASVDVST